MKPNSSGQSLVEFMLSLPLFLVFFAAILGMSKVLMVKMDLAAFCREAAIFRSRQQGIGGLTDRMDSGHVMRMVRSLAYNTGRLNPLRLSVTIEPVQALFPENEPSIGPMDPTSLLTRKMSGWLAGEKVTVTYQLEQKGLAKLLLGQNLQLSESLIAKHDPWKAPASRLFNKTLMRNQ